MAHEFSRGIRDAFWQVTQALPNQNTNNSSGSMDLKTDAFKPEDFEVEEIPAYEPIGEGEHLFLWVEKRDVGAEYFARQVAKRLDLSPGDVGTGGASGAAAQKFHFRVPSNARQYIRVNTAASATAGDSTAVSLSLRLVF